SEMAKPDVEILLAYLLELQMSGNGTAAVGAILQDHRAPEVGHLLQVWFPISLDFRRENRTEAAVGAHPGIEVADERPDKRAVHERVCERLLGRGWGRGSCGSNHVRSQKVAF